MDAIDETVAWVAADELDRPRVDLRLAPELYNLDCVAYESVLLGLFTLCRGDPPGRHKPNHVCVGFSRDGFHWARPSRAPFIGRLGAPGDWNWSNVQSAGGCCLVVGDELYFYVSGRAGHARRGDPGVCTHRPRDAAPRRLRLARRAGRSPARRGGSAGAAAVDHHAAGSVHGVRVCSSTRRSTTASCARRYSTRTGA